jgi:hypothetical protein
MLAKVADPSWTIAVSPFALYILTILWVRLLRISFTFYVFKGFSFRQQIIVLINVCLFLLFFEFLVKLLIFVCFVHLCVPYGALLYMIWGWL